MGKPMLWLQSSLEGHSPSRKVLAIVVILLAGFLLRSASAVVLSFALVAGLISSLGLLALLANLVEPYWPGSGNVAFLLGLVSFVAMFIFFRVKMRQRRVHAEAAKWLANRSKPGDPSYGEWVRRARRWSLWAPSGTALLIVLFVPETCGIVSHLLNPGAGRLYQRRVRIPLAWAIFRDSTNKETGSSHVTAWAGKGMAREWRMEPVLSSMSFGTRGFASRQDGAQQPKHAKITSTRILPVGGEMVTCWEFLPDGVHWRVWNDESFGLVSCSSSDGSFYASFGGQKGEIPGFYKILQSATQTK